MHQKKREYPISTEKREDVGPVEKQEDGKHIKCIGCNKTIIIGDVIMGRMLLDCPNCGTKNHIDRQTRKGRRLS